MNADDRIDERRRAFLGRAARCWPLLMLPAHALAGPPPPSATALLEPTHPKMLWGDTSRRGRPFSKDPSVIYFGGRYLLYYSLPPYGDGRQGDGWAVGIAESRDLVHWTKRGEILPTHDYNRNGLAAPDAIVLGDTVHLFYQTYGNGPDDALCHATSADGRHFEQNSTNPVFHPTGDWTVGRAIDAHPFAWKGALYLYYATRDPDMEVQMLGVARADLDSDYGRAAWMHLSEDGPLLKPTLDWEKNCIEAATVCSHGDRLYMFYAGAYNNEPQQIGCAVSTDAISWQRLFEEPFLPNGAPGTWNASESGHPGVFVDGDGQSYLFYQGNDDHGETWQISFVKVGWSENLPYVKTA